jgi:hypothetical protein
MTRRRVRTRARLGGPSDSRTKRVGRNGTVDAASALPRALSAAVDGVESLAVGALRLTRDVLLGAVSGAASLGAEALTTTVAGARTVLTAASRMVGDMAGAAQGTFQEARRLRAGRGTRRQPARMVGPAHDANVRRAVARRAHPRVRRGPAGRHVRGRVAA